MDEYGLREHHDRISRGVFDRADGLRTADRSHRNAARADDQRDLVFVGVVADFAGEWICELCGFRFLLGLGESANWPGASKAVSEWFPNRERGLAAAFYDSGSSVGGAVRRSIFSRFIWHWGCAVAVVIRGVVGIFVCTLVAEDADDREEHPMTE